MSVPSFSDGVRTTAGGVLHVVGADRDRGLVQLPRRRLVVDAQRAGGAARHERAAVEEGDVLRRAVGGKVREEPAPPDGDLSRRPGGHPARRRSARSRRRARGTPGRMRAAQPRPRGLETSTTASSGDAVPSPTQSVRPSGESERCRGHSHELQPADDLAVRDVHGRELDTARVGDERVPAVAARPRCSAARSKPSSTWRTDSVRAVDDRHRADVRVRDDRERSPTRSMLRGSGRVAIRARTVPVDEVDDGDVRLGVRRHERERSGGRERSRHLAQRERRRRGGEQETAPVHAGDTSGERVGVRPREQRVDLVLQRTRRRRRSRRAAARARSSSARSRRRCGEAKVGERPTGASRAAGRRRAGRGRPRRARSRRSCRRAPASRCLRRLRQLLLRPRDEQAVRLLGAAADAAAQLVQLREPEAVGLLDDHHRRVRDVDADLDHRRRDEHVELAAP